MDIEEGKRKRMRLIGCDKNEDCVKAFRKKGGLAVIGDVMHTCGALNPDAVILDYNSDVSVESVTPPIKQGGVVVFNFQRGRNVAGTPLPSHVYREVCDHTMGGTICEKHRGIYAAVLRATLWLHNNREVLLDIWKMERMVQEYVYALTQEIKIEKCGINNHWSYKADGTRGLMFDSVILRNKLFYNDWHETVAADIRSEYVKKLAPVKAHLTRRTQVAV